MTQRLPVAYDGSPNAATAVRAAAGLLPEPGASVATVPSRAARAMERLGRGVRHGAEDAARLRRARAAIDSVMGARNSQGLRGALAREASAVTGPRFIGHCYGCGRDDVEVETRYEHAAKTTPPRSRSAGALA